jgi:hypothetical protein
MTKNITPATALLVLCPKCENFDSKPETHTCPVFDEEDGLQEHATWTSESFEEFFKDLEAFDEELKAFGKRLENTLVEFGIQM